MGVFSDAVLLQNGYRANWPEIERVELVRHCRWVNEVTKDAPWELTLKFIQEKSIDYAAVDEGSSIDPNYDRARVRGYDELKRHGIYPLFWFIARSTISLPLLQEWLLKQEELTLSTFNGDLQALPPHRKKPPQSLQLRLQRRSTARRTR